MSQLFTSGGQSIRTSVSASLLPTNTDTLRKKKKRCQYFQYIFCNYHGLWQNIIKQKSWKSTSIQYGWPNTGISCLWTPNFRALTLPFLKWNYLLLPQRVGLLYNKPLWAGLDEGKPMIQVLPFLPLPSQSSSTWDLWLDLCFALTNHQATLSKHHSAFLVCLFLRLFFLFLCGPSLESLLNLLQYCFHFMVWFFGCKSLGISVPQPGIEPTPVCVGRQSLNHWTTREIPHACFEDYPGCYGDSHVAGPGVDRRVGVHPAIVCSSGLRVVLNQQPRHRLQTGWTHWLRNSGVGGAQVVCFNNLIDSFLMHPQV